MYDILELKSKLLPALQDIAKELNVPKYRTLKKMDLIYQILDVQAINPKAASETKTTPKSESKKVNTNANQNNTSNKPVAMEEKTKSLTKKAPPVHDTENGPKINPKERVLRPRRKSESQLDRSKKRNKELPSQNK